MEVDPPTAIISATSTPPQLQAPRPPTAFEFCNQGVFTSVGGGSVVVK